MGIVCGLIEKAKASGQITIAAEALEAELQRMFFSQRRLKEDASLGRGSVDPTRLLANASRPRVSRATWRRVRRIAKMGPTAESRIRGLAAPLLK
jgi:hypothetical protein